MKNYIPSFLMMAFSKGSESVDAPVRKLYTGFGTVQVLCVNPTKAELEKYTGRAPEEEPSYVSVREVEGKQVKTARVSFLVKTVADKCSGIESINTLTYFLENRYIQGSASGKYQVLDEYGRDAWATKETIDAKAEIMYSNGPARISKNYRPAYRGEVELVDFIKKFLGIPNVDSYVNGAWVMSSKPNDCVCQLDKVAKMFDGDFSEIKSAIALQPNNKVKILFGVRTTDDGKEYQDLYNKVLRNNSTAYESIKKEIEERQNNNGLQGRFYDFDDLHEYAPAPSTPSASGSDLPFSGAPASSPW